MNFHKNFRFFTVLFVSILMLLTGCSLNKEETPDKNMTLKLKGSSSFIESGKMTSPWKDVSLNTTFNFRNLFIAESISTIGYDLAESHTISEDGLTYEIVLKEDIKWSDDKAIDVDDVIFSIESVLLAENSHDLFANGFLDIVGAREYVNLETNSISGLVKNGNALTVTLLNPSFIFLPTLSQFAILPEHILKTEDVKTLNTSDFWLDPVVSGMYKYNNHIPNESVEFVYNDKFIGDTPYINSILFRADYNPEELDFFYTSSLDNIFNFRATSVMREERLDETLLYCYFVFNMERGGNSDNVLKDVRVRQALTYAIDKNKIVKDVTYSTATVLNTGIGGDHFSDLGLVHPYDPEKSKQLLHEAEYDFNRPITLLYNAGAYVDDIIELVKKDLENVGLTVELVYNPDYYYDPKFYDYDLGLKSLAPLTAAEWYYEYESSGDMHKNLFGGEPLFDELILNLDAINDVQAGLGILVDLQKLEFELIHKLPMFLLWQMAYINESRLVIPEDVNILNPWYKYDLEIERWKIEY